MFATVIVFAALWGAAAGMLLPRAAHRLSVEPEEDWRAACPAGHPFTGFAKGWVGTGRCARCAAGDGEGAASPPLRTVAGAATYAKTLRFAVVGGVACAVLAAATGDRPELGAWLLLAPFALLLAVVDRRVHRLPDVLTLPLAGGAVALLGVAELLPGDGGSWAGALLGGAGLGGAYFLLFLINPNGMGFGDVKLALALGVVLGWYGWSVLFLGAFAGFLLGALYGLGLMLARRGGRKTAIPFGPFMIAGAWAGVVVGALGAG
ncbi:A24 family peptidase [Streptomyces sp. NBC_00237]|uniref:prepilin peptidase n=1 Tax=Streptomyces sp. NBC_00237 TaxID=2975687 RepID=UPI0022503824|nr:A24 family peptidase [Streptomyces sp. NBC_00237]MCX5204499.1 A24 family peptidase [Streptomyces sp. NBC_00237]